MGDLKWFAGILLVMGILWVGSWGKGDAPLPLPPEPAGTPALTETTPANQAAQNNTGIPPAGMVMSESIAPQPDPNLSPLKGKLVIYSAQLYGPVEQEYVLIQAPYTNMDTIPITGMTLRSGENLKVQTIGNGWSLFFPGSLGEGETVMLRPGGYAYLISGHAPFALTTGSIPSRGGFQLNTCTGFFEQGLNFYPGLPIACPSPTQEPLPQAPNRLSDACYDYLASLPRCTVPSGAIPSHLLSDGNCQAHLFNKINYNQCVTYHKDEPDFFKNDWRIYFGRNSKFWSEKREVVELLDADGKVIDRRAY